MKKTVYKEAPEHTYCLCCGNEIQYGEGHGRRDKKFCDARCKNTYHNMTRGRFLETKPIVDKIIINNYEILTGLLKMCVSQMTLSEAQAMGFNPNYATTFYKRGAYTEYACYDIIYRLSDLRIFNIRRLALPLRQIMKL